MVMLRMAMVMGDNVYLRSGADGRDRIEDDH